MKKFLLSVIALMLAFWVLPTYSSAKVEDGIYSLNYQVNKAGTISASIANDYFAKPAKLFVENGKMRVQLTIKQSAWVTKFEGPHGGNDVISENKEANTRLVEFNVTDIQNLTVVKMNVDIPEMGYHHTYSTDFVWDASSLKLLEAAKKPEPKPEPKPVEPVKEEVKKEEPKAVAEPKPAAAPAPAPAAVKVEEKPAAVVKTEPKPAEEQKPAEAKPVEEKKEEPVEKATETKAVEEKATEEKAAEATKEEPAAVKVEEEKVAVANAEEATEEKEATASLTEEAEKANAPAEAKSSSSAWIYIVIALILAGAAILFMRKRSSANKA